MRSDYFSDWIFFSVRLRKRKQLTEDISISFTLYLDLRHLFGFVGGSYAVARTDFSDQRLFQMRIVDVDFFADELCVRLEVSWLILQMKNHVVASRRLLEDRTPLEKELGSVREKSQRRKSREVVALLGVRKPTWDRMGMLAVRSSVKYV